MRASTRFNLNLGLFVASLIYPVRGVRSALFRGGGRPDDVRLALLTAAATATAIGKRRRRLKVRRGAIVTRSLSLLGRFASFAGLTRFT
jgi:hypothetical protein